MPDKYELVITRSAQKEIKGLSKSDRKRVISALKKLSSEPRPANSRKLSGREAYRIRIGVIRAIYTIEDEVLVIEVIRVAHRREVYR